MFISSAEYHMTTRTPSTIAAELEAAFAGGKTERELLVLIRELRAAIDAVEQLASQIIAMPVATEFERGYQACAKRMLTAIEWHFSQ